VVLVLEISILTVIKNFSYFHTGSIFLNEAVVTEKKMD